MSKISQRVHKGELSLSQGVNLVLKALEADEKEGEREGGREGEMTKMVDRLLGQGEAILDKMEALKEHPRCEEGGREGRRGGEGSRKVGCL